MPERGARAERLLLERDAELELIEDALKASTRGVGSLLVVEGHAGVGKTRLIDEARARASALGLSVLSARGAETEQDFSFGVVLQLLQRRVMTLDARERSDVMSGAAALARPLLEGKEVGEPAGPISATALTHAVYWLVSALAERSPLLIAVDDAHWADVSSLRFLAYLANRLDGLAVTLVVARRLGEPGDASEIVDVMARPDRASIIPVEPLSDEAVTSLVRTKYDPSADESFCKACARAVSGNPFYLEVLLAGLRIRGTSADATGAEDVLTMDLAGIKNSVVARLSKAGADATRLAEIASLDDAGLRLDLAARLSDLDASAAEAAMATLSNAQILARSDPLRFVHPLVRNAVYTSLDDGRRRILHRDLAKVLRDDRDEPERVAIHVHLGEKRKESWAVDVLLEAAARATERGVPAAAASHLRAALEEDPSPEIRATIFAQLGLATLAAGDPHAGDLVREAAVASKDVSQRILYLLLAATATFQLGQYRDAVELLRWASSLEPEDQAVRMAVLGFTSGLSNVLGIIDPIAIEQFAEICDELATQPDAPRDDTQRLMFAARAGLLSLSGELHGHTAHALAARALADLTGEQITGPMFPAPMALWVTDDYDAAAAALDASVDAASRRGMLQDLTSALTHRSELRYRVGDVGATIADAQAALEGARQGIHGVEPIASAMLSLALLDSGDLQGAGRAVEGVDLERWTGLTHLALLREARGQIMLAKGQPLHALREFLAAGHIVVHARAANPAFCAWRSGAALAHHILGEKEEAGVLAAEEVDIARGFGAPRAIGIALRAQGLITTGSEGIDSLDEAARVLEPSGARLECARALTDFGAALRRRGLRSDAQERLRAALDLAAECGARGLARRAREELVAAGGRPRRERLTGLDSLTPQERRIAELVVKGSSNREVAQALFLTRKTVETHLSNAYSKLDIRSREELRDRLESTSGGALE